MKRILNNEEVSRIIELYKSDIKSTHKLGEIFNIGHKKISQILKENDIQIRNRGGQIQDKNSKKIESSKTPKYIASSDDMELIAICKKTKKEFTDVNNLSGVLTRHISELYHDTDIPSTNYLRKKYEYDHKEKWFEKYFDIIERKKSNVRKCKLCDWSTTDITNKTGCFENHIVKSHSISLSDYLSQFPEDIKYHKNFSNNIKEKEFLSDEKNYVVCELCNQKMKMISNTHLFNKHNITCQEYKLLFPNSRISSKTTSSFLSNNAKIVNINSHPTWTSNGEFEIKKFIQDLGFDVDKSKNRKLLNGKEIDLIIPSVKLAIEYDGLYYHTEKMGKYPTYHLDKTIECYNKGYNLIHIFEDEWITKKDIVKSKISHILKVNQGIKIGARKTIIKKISSKEKSVFLNKNHLQGNDNSNIFYGAFYNDKLVGVITFNSKRNMTKTNENEYELSRYAVDQDFIISGLASKFLKKFIKEYSPKSIISFADRRWTPNTENNLYTQIGFKLVKVLKPNYYYYNSKVGKYKRFHKFGFGKKSIKIKYPNLDHTKSEKVLMEELGYDRIWDCGLLKYQLTF